MGSWPWASPNTRLVGMGTHDSPLNTAEGSWLRLLHRPHQASRRQHTKASVIHMADMVNTRRGRLLDSARRRNTKDKHNRLRWNDPRTGNCVVKEITISRWGWIVRIGQEQQRETSCVLLKEREAPNDGPVQTHERSVVSDWCETVDESVGRDNPTPSDVRNLSRCCKPQAMYVERWEVQSTHGVIGEHTYCAQCPNTDLVKCGIWVDDCDCSSR